MSRPIRTLLLGVAALVALATAAVADPGPATGHAPGGMMTDGPMHPEMMDDPVMGAHHGTSGVDHEEMSAWTSADHDAHHATMMGG